MARELRPKGIHVANVIIDGMIGEDGSAKQGVLKPAEVAEAYYQLYLQKRSAWMHEIDLRPAEEKF